MQKHVNPPLESPFDWLSLKSIGPGTPPAVFLTGSSADDLKKQFLKTHLHISRSFFGVVP